MIKKFAIIVCLLSLAACKTTELVPEPYMPSPPVELMRVPGELKTILKAEDADESVR